MHVRIRCTGLIIQDNSVLLVEYEDNGIHYNLPGGGLEPGETVLEGVRREVFEETTAEVEVGPLAMMYEFAPHKQSGDYEANLPHSLHLIFECTLKNGSVPKLPQNPDPNQVAVRWVPVEELDRVLLIPNINRQIQEYIWRRNNMELIEDYRLERLKL